MRISAKIIDEEHDSSGSPYTEVVCTNVLPIKPLEEISEEELKKMKTSEQQHLVKVCVDSMLKRVCNWLAKGNIKDMHGLRKELIEELSEKMKKQEETAKECMLKQDSKVEMRFPKQFMRNHESGEHYKEMIEKFSDLNISDEEPEDKYSQKCTQNKKILIPLKDFGEVLYDWAEEMEKDKKPLKDQQSSAKLLCCLSDGETLPEWMENYFQKMKQEIKGEIMEELTNVIRQEVQYEVQNQIANPKLSENSYQQAHVFHPGIYCDNCDQLIHGVRYKCGNCADYDLCEECESLPNIHNKNHRFLKIRFPTLHKQKIPYCILPAGIDVHHSHFKSHSSKKLYEAKFVCDETVPDGTDLPPSTRFIKSWRVFNSGKKAWTHATKLQHIQGSVGLTPATEQVDVPHLRPGEEGVVSVLFTTPAVPGVYRSHWNFCHKSRPFGHNVWCHIIVKGPEVEEKQVENIPETLKLSASNLPSEKEKVASIAKVLTAVKEEHEKGNIIPRKLAVNSHTATPNNTPFDLTPPKSPDHQAMNELKIVVEDKEPDKVPAELPSLEYDTEEGGSVVSLSSSDSDAEFVVIPMPNCFNLSESFASHNISHLSQYLQSGSVSDSKDIKSECEKMLKSQNIVKSSFNAETVSQETGVPELSEHSAIQNEAEQKILISHNVTADGSSSEISIIESGDSSPTADNVTDITSVHIAITNDTESNSIEDLENNDGDNKIENPERRNSTQQEVSEKEDRAESIPGSSTTFPKFPIEGITSIYEPASSNNEEQTVQVLPEKIVTVPLNVASTVYNATMQVMSNLRRYTDPQNNQQGATGVSSTLLNPMDQLIEMGFCNRQQNEELLKKHKNNVALVVEELVSMNDNDWYASRHVPPSASSYN